MTVRRALVTGITGFVGGYLAEHLLAADWDVAGIGPPSGWEATSPAELVDKVPLLRWDLMDRSGPPSHVVQFVRDFRPTVIFHLAAISVPEKCGQSEPTPEAWQVNVEGTRWVLDLATTINPPPTVLVVSSSHVYGAVSPSAYVVDENYPLAPRTGYGKTKEKAEQLALSALDRGLPVIVARAFHHSGPRQQPPMLLPQWAKQFADPDLTEVTVYSLDVWLDLSDVRDVVRAYRLLVSSGARGVFNVGSGQAMSTGQIFDLFVKISGRNLRAKQLRPERRYEPIANIARLRKATGWVPTIPLEQTVADTLRWWQARLEVQSKGRI